MPLESLLRLSPGPLAGGSTGIVVGYSGGLDSTVLLHVLQRAHGARVRAVHVHHGLHPDADVWADHCTAFCKRLGVPLNIVRVEVREDGRGLEAAARDARHAALAEQLVAGDSLALAHHEDDQAETFLLRALRGSGPDGLAAMRDWEARGTTFLWRPLLHIPRAMLRVHAETHALDWIEDPSNADTGFDRNYLRHEILPRLRARWPQAGTALARAAGLQAAASRRLADSADVLLARCQHANGDLRVDTLMQYAVEDRALVLRSWVARLGLPPLGASHLAHIERDLLAARQDADPVFHWSGARLQRWRDRLHAATQTERPPPSARDWDGLAPHTLPDGRQWRLSPPRALPWACRVVPRRGGERIRLPGRRHRTEVKKLLQATGVPAWEREPMVLLVDEVGVTQAIPGIAVSDDLSRWLESEGVMLVVEPPVDPDSNA